MRQNCRQKADFELTDMPVHIHAALNPDDLLATLRRIDISVPARTDGRTTDHAETWTISRLLSTLTKYNLLEFPLSVMHRDRPDSLIQSNGRQIGVEITEAISQQYAAYCALAEREFPELFLEPAHFRWGAPAMTVNDMRNLLQQRNLSSMGWAGNRPEQEWALFIRSVVDSKLTKLERADFAKYCQNWLAIYDNLPLPNINLSTAVACLQPLLHDQWGKKPGFDTLLVEHGPVIVRITSSGSEHLALNDLWE